MPTVLDLLGRRPRRPRSRATSLRPALDGQRQELLAFSETWYPRFHYGWSELQAVRDGAFKFILAPTRELYDVARDPGELTNLAAGDPGAAPTGWSGRCGRWCAQTTRAEAAKGPQAIDPAAEQRLRALGYVGSTSATPSRRPAAPRPEGHHRALQPAAAGRHGLRGRVATTRPPPRCVKALAVDPEMIEGHTRLGNIHTKAGRHAEAIAAYQTALALDPAHLLSTYNLALAYRAAGKIDEAIVGFERTQQLDPRSGRAHFQLGDIYMQQAQPAKALEVLTTGLALASRSPAVPREARRGATSS